MKAKFLKKTAFLLFLVLLTSLVIALLPLIPFSYTYMIAFIDKQRTLEAAGSPKIVFVGGSNLAHGLDSALIEKATGIRVVNTGLYGGLGLKFMLDHIRSFIQQNDLIIVAPEYELLNMERQNDYTAWCFAIFADFPAGLKYVSPGDIKALQGFPDFAYSKLVFGTGFWLKHSRSNYSRDGFNKNGDALINFGKPSDPESLSRQAGFQIKTLDITNGVKTLNQFNLYANSRGGKVLFTFPPVPDVRYQKYKFEIESIYSQLRSGLKMPVLGIPRNYTFPDSYFHDTFYHLNPEGKLARTEKIIADLKKFQLMARMEQNGVTKEVNENNLGERWREDAKPKKLEKSSVTP